MGTVVREQPLSAREISRLVQRGLGDYLLAHSGAFVGLGGTPKKPLGKVEGDDVFVVPEVLSGVCASLGLDQEAALTALRQNRQLRVMPGSDSFVYRLELPTVKGGASKERGYYVLGVFSGREVQAGGDLTRTAAGRRGITSLKVGTIMDAAIPGLYKRKQTLQQIGVACNLGYGRICNYLHNQKLLAYGAADSFLKSLPLALQKALQLQGVSFAGWCAYYGFDPKQAAAWIADKAWAPGSDPVRLALESDFPTLYAPKGATGTHDQPASQSVPVAATAEPSETAPVGSYLREDELAQAAAAKSAGAGLFAIAAKVGRQPELVYRALVEAGVVPRLATSGRYHIPPAAYAILESGKVDFAEWCNFYGFDVRQADRLITEAKYVLRRVGGRLEALPAAEREIMARIAEDFRGYFTSCLPKRRSAAAEVQPAVATGAAATAEAETASGEAPAKQTRPPRLSPAAAKERDRQAEIWRGQGVGLRELADRCGMEMGSMHARLRVAGYIKASGGGRGKANPSTRAIPPLAVEQTRATYLTFAQWCGYYRFDVEQAAQAVGASIASGAFLHPIVQAFCADFPDFVGAVQRQLGQWTPGETQVSTKVEKPAKGPDSTKASLPPAAGPAASKPSLPPAGKPTRAEQAATLYGQGVPLRAAAEQLGVMMQSAYALLRVAGKLPRINAGLGMERGTRRYRLSEQAAALLRAQNMSLRQWCQYYGFTAEVAELALAGGRGEPARAVLAAFMNDFPDYKLPRRPAPAAGTAGTTETAQRQQPVAGVSSARVPSGHAAEDKAGATAASPATPAAKQQHEQLAVAHDPLNGGYQAWLVRLPEVIGRGDSWSAAVASLETTIRRVRELRLD